MATQKRVKSGKAAKGHLRVLGPARIEYLRVENYRALKAVELGDITPLTVLLGPNGSGKSTIFDVFDFLSECFTLGLRKAWDKRGRFRELRTRGCDNPIVFELRYRETPQQQPATYHLEIDEEATPVVGCPTRTGSSWSSTGTTRTARSSRSGWRPWRLKSGLPPGPLRSEIATGLSTASPSRSWRRGFLAIGLRSGRRIRA